MFDNPRYISHSVDNNLSPFMQMLLWEMIDSMDMEQDYLQIFKLIPVNINGIMVQKIIHTQEKPKYEKIIILNRLTLPINAKIYVIDDGEHSTMLFAEEY